MSYEHVICMSGACHTHALMCVCVTWLICMCDVTHLHVWRVLFTLLYMCDVAPWHNSSIGWRRPIGCLKLQVIFRKRAINYRALLQEMTYKDKASYGSSPLCICITWLIHMCNMTHSHVRHDAFTCPTRLFNMCDMTWLNHVCDMTHWHVWHDSSIPTLCMCMPWLIHICAMTHSHVRHDSFTCVTRFFNICDMTHTHVWHDWLIYMTWLIHTDIGAINFLHHNTCSVPAKREGLLFITRRQQRWHGTGTDTVTHTHDHFPLATARQRLLYP